MIGSETSNNIHNNRGRNELGATQTLSNINNSSSKQHEYPQPKQFKNKSHHFLESHPFVFEELTGNTRSYHHRYTDNLAFENRHKKLLTNEPNAFKKEKRNTDLQSQSVDLFGNPKIIIPTTLEERIQNYKTIKSTTSLSIQKRNSNDNNNNAYDGNANFSNIKNGYESSSNINFNDANNDNGNNNGNNTTSNNNGNITNFNNTSNRTTNNAHNGNTNSGNSNNNDSGNNDIRNNGCKGWTRLSKTNVGFPLFSKDMPKNNVSLVFPQHEKR